MYQQRVKELENEVDKLKQDAELRDLREKELLLNRKRESEELADQQEAAKTNKMTREIIEA